MSVSPRAPRFSWTSLFPLDLPPFLRRKKAALDISDLLLSPFAAIEELKRRRENPVIEERVKQFLKGEISNYLHGDPILYLARHIVTPNFETIRFTHLIKDLGLKTVVSQDSKGLFVSQNLIKRALCKL